MCIEFLRALEHNLLKNVSNRQAFLWQTQIQAIEYGLYDTIQIKKKEVTFKNTLPSNMNV